MPNLADATPQLLALIDLLRHTAAIDLSAEVIFGDQSEAENAPELLVELSGSDAPMLLERHGELLYALEHVAAKMIGLKSDEHDRLSLNTGDFKSSRDSELHRLIHTAIVCVRTTGEPYIFPPMMPRERRFLHLALAQAGLRSSNSGERDKRSVILYPEDVHTRPDRMRAFTAKDTTVRVSMSR